MWVQVNNQGSSHNLRSCSIWRKKKNTGLSFLKTTVRTVIHLFNILSSNCVSDRDITLPTKVRTVKAMVFPVVMYEFERWITKKAECWRIDAFELWCWRLLRVPWTARRSNQSILKEIRKFPDYSLERLMLKLKFQYCGHLIRRADSLERFLNNVLFFFFLVLGTLHTKFW